MLRQIMRYTALLTILSMPLIAPLATAEIYKWVDEDGNVHFGDKPLDSGQAAAAEEVELKESYKPAHRSAAEQADYDRQQEVERRRSEATRRSEKEARDKAAAERKESKARNCAAYKESLAALTTTQVGPGGQPIYYYVKENGKSVTSQRQREIIEELKAKMAREGCP